MSRFRLLLSLALALGLSACSLAATPELQPAVPSPSPSAPAPIQQSYATLEPALLASPTPALEQIELQNLSRLRELARIGGGARQISEFAFSPEGRVLALLWKEGASTVCHVSLVDISTPSEIDETQTVELFQLEGEPFTCEEGFTGFPNLAFSPDGRSLATVSIQAGAVTFWDTLTGQSLRTLPWNSQGAPVYGVVFSPNWDRLAWISRDRVQIMQLESGTLGHVLQHQDFVSSAVFSPDGALLATASLHTTNGRPTPAVRLWKVDSGRVTRTLTGPPAGASVLRFSPDGKSLLWGAWNGQVHYWDLSSGEGDSQVGDGVHSDAISSLSYSLDQRFIASAGRDHSVKIAPNPRLAGIAGAGGELTIPTLPGERADFSPDGRLIAVVLDGVVSLWGVRP